MDGISAIANIINLAEGAFRIVGYLKSVKEGGKARQSLLEELTLLWLVLEGLRQQFDPAPNALNEPWMRPLKPLFEEPEGVFSKIRKEVKYLETKLVRGSHKTSRFATTIKWPFQEQQVYRTIDIIRSLQALISSAMAECNLGIARDIRKDICSVKSLAEDAHLQKVLSWLSPLNFRQKESEVLSLAENSSWVLDTTEFKSWCAGEARFLWCNGAPGAGKSVLASIAFSELRRTHSTHDVFVAIIYCSFDNAESQSLSTILASLLKQLIQDRCCLPDDVKQLYQTMVIEEKSRPDPGDVQQILEAEIEKLKSTFIVIDGLDEVGDVTARRHILDALQSLGRRTRIMITSRLLEDLHQRLSKTPSSSSCNGCGTECRADYMRCKQCATCTLCHDCFEAGMLCKSEDHDFEPNATCLSLKFRAKERDISKYARRRIALSDELARCVAEKPTLEQEIVNSVVRKSENIFLLARLHLDTLAAECLTPMDVKNAINLLTPDIDDTYDKAFYRMQKQLQPKPRLWQKVQQLLLWVAWAEEPLRIDQLGHALATIPGLEMIAKESILPIQEMTAWCAGLLYVDCNNYVRVIHPTVDRYLKRNRGTRFPGGNEAIAKTCLNYLQIRSLCKSYSGPNKDTVLRLKSLDHPLLEYAAAYWGTHAHRCTSADVDCVVLALLRSPDARNFAVQIQWHLSRLQRKSWDTEYNVSALHIAALFGLNRLILSLVRDGIDVNARDGMGVTPLMYAAARGHLNVVETLLSHDASINDACFRGSTALSRATASGKLVVATRLLEERSIDVNPLDRTQRYISHGLIFYSTGLTPLMIAASGGYHEIMNLLLSHECLDVNKHTSSPYLDTALTYATRCGDRHVVGALLQHPRIDLNACDSTSRTALHWASLSGHLDITQDILQKEADLNRRDWQKGTALMRACDGRHTPIVRLLVELGANRDLKDMFGRTALHSAAVNGARCALRFMIDTCPHLDINLQDNDGITPLHDAVSFTQVETVKVLVKKGARCDIQDKSGRTALQAALDAERTYRSMLNERQRSIYGVDTKQAAILKLLKSASGYVETERMAATPKPLWRAILIDPIVDLRRRISEASISELNDPGLKFKGSALHVACLNGKVEVLQLLLEAGADPNIKDGFGRTPLYLAQNLESISALINHGADINWRWTPHSPVWQYFTGDRGRPNFAAFLMENGAEFEPTAYRITDVLHSAVIKGYSRAVKRLVESGVSVDVQLEGYTALDRARHLKRDDIADIIVEIIDRNSDSAPNATSEADAPHNWELVDTTSIDSYQIDKKSAIDLPSVSPFVRKEMSHAAALLGQLKAMRLFGGLEFTTRQIFGATAAIFLLSLLLAYAYSSSQLLSEVT